MELDIQALEKIVREAGRMLRDANLSDEGVFAKSGDANFVTVYDVKIQQFLIEKLHELVPDASFFGEEDTDGSEQDHLSAGYTFIIDPIDGTTNFMFGYHHSCISVGVAYAGELVTGCIYNPYVENMYVAEKGKGCRCNSVRQQIKDLPVSEGIVSFGCARYNASNVDLLFDVVKTMFHRSLSVRCGGSGALDLARVATGSNVAYLELKLNPYDYAAAAIMIEEAGGVIVQMDGSPITLDRPCSILAGTKAAVAEILDCIRAAAQ